MSANSSCNATEYNTVTVAQFGEESWAKIDWKSKQ